MTGTMDKIKAKVEQVVHPSSHGTSHSTNAGPHDSNIANKADPRVDSDRDGSRNLGAAGHTTGITGTTGTTTGHGITGHGTSTNAGPHDTNVANKLDPRVDSDRDGSRNLGAAGGAHTGTGLTGTHTAGTGLTGGTHTGTTGLTGSHGTSTNAGPHNSNIANKLDPRVDSDRDGSRNLGAAGGAHTTTGGIGGAGLTHNTASTNAGPHNSNLANKVDPRVDSDRDGSRNAGFASHGPHSGTGPATNTAGPHSSNLANKLDPRVDSDLDGSATVGQGQGVAGTHRTTGTTGAF